MYVISCNRGCVSSYINHTINHSILSAWLDLLKHIARPPSIRPITLQQCCMLADARLARLIFQNCHTPQSSLHRITSHEWQFCIGQYLVDVRSEKNGQTDSRNEEHCNSNNHPLYSLGEQKSIKFHSFQSRTGFKAFYDVDRLEKADIFLICI